MNMASSVQEEFDVIDPPLDSLLREVKRRSGLNLKRDISAVSSCLPSLPEGWHFNGDDTAAIPMAGNQGYQLLAIEGMQTELVKREPWFAGWCGVMVNCSDIAAMGGTPTSVVNALWSSEDSSQLEAVLKGMVDASEHLGVPIVGGHTNLKSDQPNLAVSILGYARHLLSSFAAKPRHQLIAAIDLRGAFQGSSLNWNAATSAPAIRIRQDLALLPQIAEQQLAVACKDISQAGLLGTTVMLLESSNCGAQIDLNAIPKPVGVAMTDWLCAFPSFGYLLTAPAGKSEQLVQQFHQRDIHAAVIGELTDDRQLRVFQGNQQHLFYDLNQEPLTGFS